jgi:hypothetical protein
MSVYSTWGYRENPFQPTALTPDELGVALLIGRDIELGSLSSALNNPPKIPTVEGPNGVGKTSLINVSAFLCYRAFMRSGAGPLLIPCDRTFQLAHDSNLERFVTDALMGVAQTLIRRRSEFDEKDRRVPQLRQLDRWLNSPVIDGWQASIGVPFGSLGLGGASQPNEGVGYARSGLRRDVITELARIFSPGEGVVCVIDNLELLQTSDRARQTFEQLRDELFHIPGLRWVLAGSNGIIHGVASSSRLNGYLHRPLAVGGVNQEFAPKILESRRRAFAVEKRKLPYMPLSPEDFSVLYDLQNENLRAVLSLADEYCTSLDGAPNLFTPEQKRARFSSWLRETSNEALLAVESSLTNRCWEMFDTAAGMGGEFSPSDCEVFGFNDPANLRVYVKELEQVGLMTSTIDETDKRRRNIAFTAKAWLVHYARCLRGGTVA